MPVDKGRLERVKPETILQAPRVQSSTQKPERNSWVDEGIQEATIHSLETIPLAGVSISR